MSFPEQVLSLLVCPACHAGVTHVGDELICSGCALAYPVRDDIPILLVDEARKPA